MTVTPSIPNQIDWPIAFNFIQYWTSFLFPGFVYHRKQILVLYIVTCGMAEELQIKKGYKLGNMRKGIATKQNGSLG